MVLDRTWMGMLFAIGTNEHVGWHTCRSGVRHGCEHHRNLRWITSLMEEEIMDPSTFYSTTPNELQTTALTIVRNSAAGFSEVLESWLPSGPDKTYVLRTLRTAAMWASVAILRNPDGSPRC